MVIYITEKFKDGIKVHKASYIKNFTFLFVIIFTISCTTYNKPLVHIPATPPNPLPINNVGIALVLGGGGSKGAAHIGVLEVFEKYHIPIDLIVGTSAGSAIGALYADEPNSQSIKNKVLSVKKWDLLDISFIDTIQSLSSLKGPVRGYAYQKFLHDNIKSKNFESLKIPLIAVTTDIEANKEFIIRSGPIAPAINASSAIPPVFSPVKMYDRILVDGGVIAPVPVAIAKEFNPKLTIAVDISAPPDREALTNIGWLTYRSISIFYYELARMQSKLADIEIHPDTDGYGIFEDDKLEELYEAGKRAAEAAIPSILSHMKARNILLRSHSVLLK
ncbi:MAG: patatin-like phospholipase family protein [Alphaproteobacteria bacterium]